MKIKEFKKFELSSCGELTLNLKETPQLPYLINFLFEGSFYLQRLGVLKFIEWFYSESGINGFSGFFVSIDRSKDLIYIGFESDIDEMVFRNFENLSDLELCQQNIIGHLVLTKKNFIHILTLWQAFLLHKPVFVVFYRDDKDWYDIVSFNSQEEMELFVKNHTQLFS